MAAGAVGDDLGRRPGLLLGTGGNARGSAIPVDIIVGALAIIFTLAINVVSAGSLIDAIPHRVQGEVHDVRGSSHETLEAGSR